MFMIHYYLQKGISPEKIAALTPLEKAFYAASMELAYDEQAEYLNAMGGGK